MCQIDVVKTKLTDMYIVGQLFSFIVLFLKHQFIQNHTLTLTFSQICSEFSRMKIKETALMLLNRLHFLNDSIRVIFIKLDRHFTLFIRKNRDPILSTKFDRQSTLFVEMNKDTLLSFKFIRTSSAEISQTYLEKLLADTEEKCWELSPGTPYHIERPE